MTTEQHNHESIDSLFSGLGISQAKRKQKAPFKFLDPYGPDDRDIFFGRELETSEIYARFYKSRLLLVYGESGSGKTSLLQCGLRTAIPPEDAIFITIRSAINPLSALKREILNTIPFPGKDVPAEYSDLLEEASYRKSKTLVLVFDQFEEFFIFQPESARKEFLDELSKWLKKDINVRIVICIREEFLARLTEFESKLPLLYQNRLWVRRMSKEQAREVITKPCEECSVGIEEALVRELLDEMIRGGKGIELPILQVVLDTLYNQAIKASPGSPQLTLSSYQGLGKTQSILARFIEDRVGAYKNGEQARQALKVMVTSEGTRQICSRKEILENVKQFGAPISESDLTALLRNLINDRIIREDTDNHLYELRHDSLAQTIHNWMTAIEKDILEVRLMLENRFKEYQGRKTLLDAETLKYIAPYEDRLFLKGEMVKFIEKSKKEAQRRRKRRMAFAGVAIGVFVLIVGILGVISYFKANEAGKNLQEARRNIGLVFNEKAKVSIANKDLNAARVYSLLALANFNLEDKDYRGKRMAKIVIRKYQDYPIIFSSPIAKHHDAAVKCVMYSSDGKTLASGSDDGTIKLWDMASGKEVSTLTGHSEGVTRVAYSPDGKTLASASVDTTIKLWDIASGKEITTLTGHSNEVTSVAYSPDGKMLASGSGDGTFTLWDVALGKEVATLTDRSGVLSVAYSPDGKTLALAVTGPHIIVRDSASGKEITTLAARANAVAYSPDGKTLASANGKALLGWHFGFADTPISLWDIASGKEIATLTGHSSNGVNSLTYSPDGKTLASASGDTTINLWEIASRKKIATLTGHSHEVNSVTYSPDGKTLASGSDDGTIKLWDMASRKKIATLMGHSREVNSLTYSPDGKTLAFGSDDGTIKLWDIASGKEITTLTGHSGGVMSVTYSPDGKTLASASGDTTIKLWDIASGEEITALTGHSSLVTSVTYSPDGKTLASASCDGNITLWDIASGKETTTLTGHSSLVTSVTYSPDGKALASASCDGITLWDVASGKEITTLTGHSSAVTSVTYSPDGKTLASASCDGNITLWGMAARLALAGSDDDTITLWNNIEAYKINLSRLSWAEIIHTAKRDYNLALEELELKQIPQTDCLHFLRQRNQYPEVKTNKRR